MAVEIAALKPFAVDGAWRGDVLAQELAKRKIVTIQQGVSFDTAVASDPYVWGGLASGIPEPLLAITAKYIAQRLAGRPAKWAGDPSYQTKKRVFGLIVNDTVDKKVYESYFKKYKVPLASVVTYAATLGPQFAEQAPTMIQKLRSAGVTTVINVVPFTDNKSLTNIATQQEFFPEWFLTGSFSQDISLLGRTFDQEQWSHAFGLGTYPPVPTALAWYNHLTDWYYGTDKPDYRTTGDAMKRPNLIIAQYRCSHCSPAYTSPVPTSAAELPRRDVCVRAIGRRRLQMHHHVGALVRRPWPAPRIQRLLRDDVVGIYWDAEQLPPANLPASPAGPVCTWTAAVADLTTVPKANHIRSTPVPRSTRRRSQPRNDKVPDYPCDNCPGAKTSS
jgi:hypothetical protein